MADPLAPDGALALAHDGGDRNEAVASALDPLALDPALPMEEWELPLIVQLVKYRIRNGTIASVSANDLKRGAEETISEFLRRLVELLLQQPFYDNAEYMLYADRTDDIQQIIRNMFPAVCIPSAIRRPMAQNLAFGVTHWRWFNELMNDEFMGSFAFHVERDAQRSLVQHLEDLIDEWNVATKKYHGREISLAGFTFNTGDLCFEGVEPNIVAAKYYLQELARKFGKHVADGNDDNDDDGGKANNRNRSAKRPRPVQ